MTPKVDMVAALRRLLGERAYETYLMAEMRLAVREGRIGIVIADDAGWTPPVVESRPEPVPEPPAESPPEPTTPLPARIEPPAAEIPDFVARSSSLARLAKEKF